MFSRISAFQAITSLSSQTSNSNKKDTAIQNYARSNGFSNDQLLPVFGVGISKWNDIDIDNELHAAVAQLIPYLLVKLPSWPKGRPLHLMDQSSNACAIYEEPSSALGLPVKVDLNKELYAYMTGQLSTKERPLDSKDFLMYVLRALSPKEQDTLLPKTWKNCSNEQKNKYLMTEILGCYVKDSKASIQPAAVPKTQNFNSLFDPITISCSHLDPLIHSIITPYSHSTENISLSKNNIEEIYPPSVKPFPAAGYPLSVQAITHEVDNDRPILQDPITGESVTGDADKIRATTRTWIALHPFLEKLSDQEQMNAKRNMIDQAKDWVRSEGKHSQRFDEMLSVERVVDEEASRGTSVFAKQTIPAFTVIGPYSGIRVPDHRMLEKLQADQGAGNVQAYLYQAGPVSGPNKDRAISAYGAGNILSLINDAELDGVILGADGQVLKNNIVPISINDKVFLVTTRQINQDEELFLDYGPDYQAHFKEQQAIRKQVNVVKSETEVFVQQVEVPVTSDLEQRVASMPMPSTADVDSDFMQAISSLRQDKSWKNQAGDVVVEAMSNMLERTITIFYDDDRESHSVGENFGNPLRLYYRAEENHYDAVNQNGLVINMPKDGNCFFHAIAATSYMGTIDTVDAIPDTTHQAKSLRAQVTDHILDHQDHYQPFFISIEDDIQLNDVARESQPKRKRLISESSPKESNKMAKQDNLNIKKSLLENKSNANEHTVQLLSSVIQDQILSVVNQVISNQHHHVQQGKKDIASSTTQAVPEKTKLTKEEYLLERVGKFIDRYKSNSHPVIAEDFLYLKSLIALLGNELIKSAVANSIHLHWLRTQVVQNKLQAVDALNLLTSSDENGKNYFDFLCNSGIQRPEVMRSAIDLLQTISSHLKDIPESKGLLSSHADRLYKVLKAADKYGVSDDEEKIDRDLTRQCERNLFQLTYYDLLSPKKSKEAKNWLDKTVSKIERKKPNIKIPEILNSDVLLGMVKQAYQQISNTDKQNNAIYDLNKRSSIANETIAQSSSEMVVITTAKERSRDTHLSLSTTTLSEDKKTKLERLQRARMINQESSSVSLKVAAQAPHINPELNSVTQQAIKAVAKKEAVKQRSVIPNKAIPTHYVNIDRPYPMQHTRQRLEHTRTTTISQPQLLPSFSRLSTDRKALPTISQPTHNAVRSLTQTQKNIAIEKSQYKAITER